MNPTEYERHLRLESKRFAFQARPTRIELEEFLVRNYAHPDLEVDFTRSVVRNLVAVGYSYFIELSKTKRFHYLRAMGHAVEVALLLKLWEYQLSRNDADWFWQDVPFFFGSLSNMIQPLENLSRELGTVDLRRLRAKLLLVEGESEFEFLHKLRHLTGYANFRFDVYNYKGKGNIRNLIQYIKEKNRQGVKVLMIYDCDGTATTFVRRLRDRGCKIYASFGFKWDFEGSFPPKQLHQAVASYYHRYQLDSQLPTVHQIRTILKSNCPFVVQYEKEFGIALSKPKLSVLLAEQMAVFLEYNWNDVFNRNLKSLRYEVYDFLKFVTNW